MIKDIHMKRMRVRSKKMNCCWHRRDGVKGTWEILYVTSMYRYKKRKRSTKDKTVKLL